MKKKKTTLKWAYFVFFAFLTFQFTWSQNPVDSWTISSTPATDQDSYTVGGNTYEYGQGNNIEVTSVTFNGNVFTIPFASQSYTFKRVDIIPNSDGVNVVGNKASIFYERTGASNYIYGPSLPGTPGNIDLEEILKSTIINRGSLDVFKNTGTNSGDQGPSNIERVDVIFPALTINNAADLPLNGFLASEKSGNNSYKAAAILSLDASGEPASYGNLVTIQANTSYGIPADDSYNPRRSNAFIEDSNSDNQPLRVGGANERIGISLITFADLGIAAGQTFYGISFFGDDVFDTDNLLDPTTFPNTTGTGADIYGALGAIVTATGFVPPSDNDNDLVADIDDLDDDNDGILDSVELSCSNGVENISATAVNTSIDNVALHDGSSTAQTLTQTFTIPGCTANQDVISYQVTAYPSQLASNTTNICADVDSFKGFSNALGDNIAIDKAAGCDGGIRYRIEFTSGAEILDLTSLTHGNLAADEAITITSSVPLTGITFKRDTADASNDGTNGGSLVTGSGTTSVTIDNVSGPFGGNLNIWEVSSNGVPVSWVEIDYRRSSGSTAASYEAFTLNHTLPCDNDCDGTPNYLDTDSDNDGCPDAVEAAGSFTTADLTADDNLANVPADVDANGIPTIAVSPQATTAAVTDANDDTACAPAGMVDSDNDGINDDVDLDDDNDGIPDTEENSSCVIVTDLNTPNFAINNDLVVGGPTGTADLNGFDSSTFDFLAQVSGTSTWAEGVQIQNNPQIGDFIYVQPENTNTGTSDIATYEFTFPTPVSNFTFITGGLNNADVVVITASLGGVDIPLDENNFGNILPGIVLSGNTLEGTVFDNSFNPLINRFTTTIPGLVDSITIVAGKGNGTSTQVSMGFHSFGYCVVDPTADFDGDGIINSLDLDSDNDGILDIIEAGGTDSNNDGEVDYPTVGDAMTMVDTNMNGLDDGVEANPLSINNSDASGGPDYLDIDADNDGIPDNIEAQFTSGYIPPSGVGMGMTDLNLNGIDDAYESGGAFGISPVNTDSGLTNSDSLPDYIDNDSDGDGISDIQENGSSENSIIGADIDNDGLDDAFDDNDDSAIAGSTVNDGINPPNAGNLGDQDGDLSTGGDLDYRDEVAVDSDGDGVTDDQEITDGTDPNNPCNYTAENITVAQTGAFLVADCDGDGVTNGDEIDPDGDGTPGGTGPNGPATNPQDPCNFNSGDETVAVSGAYLDADCDSDGLNNEEEITGIDDPATTANPNGNITDPLDPDTDGDGNNDSTDPNSLVPTATDDSGSGTPEVPVVIDILGNDDYLDNLDAANLGTTTITDTGNGTAIGVVSIDADTGELTYTPDATEAGTTVTVIYEVCNDESGTPVCTMATVTIDIGILDSDGDGVTDDQEVADGTDPNNPCDFMIASITEVQTGTYLDADCDGDGVTNDQEITDGTNPEDPCDFNSGNITLAQTGDYLISDCDGDGVSNGDEIADGTNPADPCDYTIANVTLMQGGDWAVADCDGDNIPNGTEVGTDNTDPFDPCDSVNGTPPTSAGCNVDVKIVTDLVGPGINNGAFEITNIEEYPNNTVRVYNRWGILVFETQGYDNQTNAFRGISNGRATINENNELPVGVYFYIVEYVKDGNTEVLDGYLYVNR